jgi:2-iminobutanoate/2-iminopropanoate deaminase
MSNGAEAGLVERTMFWPPVEEDLGYSMTARVGDTLYVSGNIGHDAGELPNDPALQYALVYKNIAEVLARHGATLADVAMERVYYTAALKDLDPAVRRRIRGEAYGTSFPASTWAQVCDLLAPGSMVEVEVTVALKPRA